METTQVSLTEIAEQSTSDKTQQTQQTQTETTDSTPTKTKTKTKTQTKTTDSPTTTTTDDSPRAAKSFSAHTDNRYGAKTNQEQTNANEKEQTCPECGGDVRNDAREHERLCNDCGLVLDDQNIDHGPEWRAYDSQEREQKARTGAPSSNMVHDKGLSTTIDWKDKDANGNSLSTKQRRKMSRLRTWDERARAKDSQERNLKQALGEIERMASALDIPDDVREMASVIYRRCLDEDMLRGRCIESMTTASLYAASRQAQLPRSMCEFIKVSRIEEQRITRAYRYISRELSLKVKPPEATQYIPKIASEVNASSEIEKEAETLLTTAIEAGEHSGKHPNGLAAAALYAADLLSGRVDELTQANLADAAEVCEVTIRNRHREILEINDKEPRLASPGTAKTAAHNSA